MFQNNIVNDSKKKKGFSINKRKIFVLNGVISGLGAWLVPHYWICGKILIFAFMKLTIGFVARK